jgi:hypothetical protein
MSKKTRRNVKRGGGYGFGGSILGDAGGSNAGNAKWTSDTSTDCAVNATRGGSRRRRRHRGGQVNSSLTFSRGQNATGGKRSRHRRRRHRGGGLAQNIPRANYSFGGDGVAGMINWKPDSY